jgi:hypothetical protein
VSRVGLWQLCVKSGECVPLADTQFYSLFAYRIIAARVLGACAIVAAVVPVFIHVFLAWAKQRGRPAVLNRQIKFRLRQLSCGAGITVLLFTAAFCVCMATTADDPDTFGPSVYLTIGAWVCCAALLATVDRKMASTVRKEAQRNVGESC